MVDIAEFTLIISATEPILKYKIIIHALLYGLKRRKEDGQQVSNIADILLLSRTKIMNHKMWKKKKIGFIDFLPIRIDCFVSGRKTYSVIGGFSLIFFIVPNALNWHWSRVILFHTCEMFRLLGLITLKQAWNEFRVNAKCFGFICFAFDFYYGLSTQILACYSLAFNIFFNKPENK